MEVGGPTLHSDVANRYRVIGYLTVSLRVESVVRPGFNDIYQRRTYVCVSSTP